MKEKNQENKDVIHKIIRKNEEKDIGQVNKKSKRKVFKPIIIASVLAIATGTVLGVIMLNMFTSIDEKQVATTNNQISAGTVDDNEEQNETAGAVSGTKSTELESWSAFIIQGGVFSERSNAEELATTFESSGHAPVIWEKDNQYFILLGISETEEGAERIAEEISNTGHDVFVKGWETANKSVDLTEEEQKWMESFTSEWKSTLETISDEDKGFSQKNWEALLENNFEANESLNNFSKQLTATFNNYKEADKIDHQQLLLEIWLLYEELM